MTKADFTSKVLLFKEQNLSSLLSSSIFTLYFAKSCEVLYLRWILPGFLDTKLLEKWNFETPEGVLTKAQVSSKRHLIMVIHG